MTENELLAFINERANLTPLRPAGFGITVTEYAKANNISTHTARTFLDRLVDEGVLKKELMNTRKTNPYVYARPGDWAKVV